MPPLRKVVYNQNPNQQEQNGVLGFMETPWDVYTKRCESRYAMVSDMNERSCFSPDTVCDCRMKKQM